MPTAIKVELQAGVTGGMAVNAVSSGRQIEIYFVTFDAVGATSYDAYTADATAEDSGAVPAFYDAAGPLIVLQKDATQMTEDPRMWVVTVVYGLPMPGQEVRPADPDIERWGVEWNGASTSREVEIQKDKDGKWLKNSALDPLTGITETKYDAEHVVTFTSAYIDYDLISSLIGKMNDDDVTINQFGNEIVFPKNTALFVAWQYTGVPDPDGNIYPRISWRILYRSDTWVRKIADKGLRSYNEDGDPMPIIRNGCLVTDPQYLNGSGQLAGEDDPVSELPFKLQGEADFTDLLAGLST